MQRGRICEKDSQVRLKRLPDETYRVLGFALPKKWYSFLSFFQVCYYEISFIWYLIIFKSDWEFVLWCLVTNMQLVSEKTRNESARAVMSSSRPGSSGELSENRSSKLFSSGTQKIQPGQESKPTARLGRNDDALRSFDLLTIGSGKRKWVEFGRYVYPSWIWEEDERKESLSLFMYLYNICS